MDNQAIINFPGNKIIMSVSAADLIGKSFKLKLNLIAYLGSGVIKMYSIHGKDIYVDTSLKSDDYNVYNEFYSPLLKIKK